MQNQGCKGVMVGLGLLLAVGAGQGEALGESYVAGQVGATFPQDLQGVNLLGEPPAGVDVSDLDLFNSLMYGGKVGHYFNAVPWVGVEAEAFSTTPNIKQQEWVVGGTSTGIQPGLSMRVSTVALNVMARYPGKRIQPYVGVGPGLYFARMNSTGCVNEAQPEDSSSDSGPNAQEAFVPPVEQGQVAFLFPGPANYFRTDPTNGTVKHCLGESTASALGLNALAGVRVMLTGNWAAFAEYKFNRARFSFDRLPNATYNAHTLSFGVGYHFDLVQ